MIKALRVACVLLAGCWACSAPAAELGVLAPVVQNGQPLQRADPQGRNVPVVTRVRDGALYEQLQREAREGFTSTVLALDELAQRRAGASTPSTTWLFLAIEDGGFARQGFWLREGTQERYVPQHYVDLVVDVETVRNGGFEETFAHEMGHVFLRRLFPRLPQGYSRTPHHSFSITDYPTAFDEGFATHFQALVRRLTRNEALKEEDLGLASRPFVPYWLSNLDRAARIDGVRRNWFVQQQVTPMGGDDALERASVSTLFDTARLRNGNQMMACEGVIATLFYRWLVPGAGDEQSVIKRYGALFDALVRLNERTFQPDSPLFPELVQTYADTSPQDGARVLAMVVDTTYGATVDATLTPQVEKLAALGRIGDEGFIDDLGAARKALTSVRDAVVKAPATLGAALGPNVWLLTSPTNGKPPGMAMAINLNTAEREALVMLPGIGDPTATRALQNRRENGPYQNLMDFIARVGIESTSTTAKLESMAQALQKAGTFPRD